MGTIAERSLLALLILLTLALAVIALKGWQKRKARGAHGLLALPTGKAALVYFHSASCGVCRASQKPILDGLFARLDASKVKLISIDVDEQAEIVLGWG